MTLSSTGLVHSRLLWPYTRVAGRRGRRSASRQGKVRICSARNRGPKRRSIDQKLSSAWPRMTLKALFGGGCWLIFQSALGGQAQVISVDGRILSARRSCSKGSCVKEESSSIKPATVMQALFGGGYLLILRFAMCPKVESKCFEARSPSKRTQRLTRCSIEAKTPPTTPTTMLYALFSGNGVPFLNFDLSQVAMHGCFEATTSPARNSCLESYVTREKLSSTRPTMLLKIIFGGICLLLSCFALLLGVSIIPNSG